MACRCQYSNFLDKDHQHVITCDLKIIENNKLRKMFTKGRKHTQKNNISWERSNPSIKEGLNNSIIDTWCNSNKHGSDKSILTEWRYKVISKVDEKIYCLTIHLANKSLLQLKELLHTLNNIYNEFLVTAID